METKCFQGVLAAVDNDTASFGFAQNEAILILPSDQNSLNGIPLKNAALKKDVISLSVLVIAICETIYFNKKSFPD
ncbi:MAG: hypothetical protein ACI3XZ_08130 [Butyricicoccus sp.]